MGLLAAMRTSTTGSLASIPVIFLSARAGEDARSEGSFLSLPFSCSGFVIFLSARAGEYSRSELYT